MAAILLAAKLGSLVERLRQPAVLGELIAGVMLGNAPVLRNVFECAKHDPDGRGPRGVRRHTRVASPAFVQEMDLWIGPVLPDWGRSGSYSRPWGWLLVFTADLYSVVIGMVVLTILVTPPVFAYLPFAPAPDNTRHAARGGLKQGVARDVLRV